MLFTAIADELKYPLRFKQRLRTEHLKIIEYGVKHCQKNRTWHKRIIFLMNTVSCYIVQGESFSIDYEHDDLLDTFPLMNDDEAKDILESNYCESAFIKFFSIEWDIKPVESDNKSTASAPLPIKSASVAPSETPKEDLYLRAPQYPRYDTQKYWLNEMIGSEHFYMHSSLPIIPEKQNDISCTTDVSMMTDKDLLKLYPNHLIRTRHAVMYEPIDDIDYDEDLGLILPIKGYTKKMLRDNILQYPHFYQLTRIVGGEEISFYRHIEIDGELHDTLNVWDTLPDTKKLPKTAEFIKEYIIRRYLLERDKGVEHKYPLRGSLQPYLTLFAPAEFYTKHKCGEPVELARQCVNARVDFFKTRNPYLVRYRNALGGQPTYNTIDCPFKPYCRKLLCDASCPDNAEFSFLMERNKISHNDQVFMSDTRTLSDVSEWLTAASNSYKVVISPNSSETASALSYAAICNSWYGNRFHCAVYHLNFATYLDTVQKSWGMAALTDEMEYEQIFIAKARMLIVSNLEYVKFNDFAAQTLLNLVHTRQTQKLGSIVVSPNLPSLMGSGMFFDRMKQVFGEAVLNK